jgi:sulfite reductase (NADPH) flavoprotein alpha-component
MTAAVRAVPALIIPDDAPFTPEQRAWLSGFFAGLIGPGTSGATALAAPPDLLSNDDAPWHDPAMPLDRRLDLAKGRSLPSRLMAAMAQQDCGQCGYDCANYAKAIFERREQRLNLCVPGGKETTRAVKALAAELEASVTAPAVVVPSSPEPAPRLLGRSRETPTVVRFLNRHRLNREGSEKETWHVEFDLAESGLDYVVGDSFGVFPENDLGLVDQIIAMLGASHLTPVGGSSLREVLRTRLSLAPAPDALFELISYLSGGVAREKARALSRGEDPDGDAETLDVLAVLHKFSGVRPHPEAFVEAIEPLQPRLYSISSSPRATPGRLSITVDAVRYVIGKRHRLGVASTFISNRLAPGANLKAYVQRAHAFGLPDNPATPIIMIGPGTGVAPFRAFLQERAAAGGAGRAWLFYGHQRQATDFFYRDEFATLKASGILTRLSLAWSRDGAQKIYVQDRLRESGADVWAWLAEGAHIYVCGDAKRMAKDVEAALIDIVARHGARSLDEAVVFVSGLKKAGRYQTDVY